MKNIAIQQCINIRCASTYDIGEVLHKCPECGNLLDVEYDWPRIKLPKSLREIESRWANRRDAHDFSGVWRFRELLQFADMSKVITIGEGQTQLRTAPKVAEYVDLPADKLYLQCEGMNPSGSFKDNGMTAAFTHANMVGAKLAACASTGNTSASLAALAAASEILQAVVFVGSGKIAFGKLSQALDYGAKTIQIEGDFDDAMARVQEVCTERGLYLMNSLNPFRLEGQKAIMYRVLEGLRWEVPDWVIVPGGNLGNSSAFGKAFIELKRVGLIKRMPRVAIINSTGARTLYALVNEHGLKWNQGDVDDTIIDGYYRELDERGIRAHTIASAIEINRPVNLKKALRTLEVSDGVVREVPDELILDAKAQVGGAGVGCEPASAASVAGARLLRREGLIGKNETVACVLTGHQLKDPNATVAYHSATEEELREKYGSYGVKSARYGNHPVLAKNDLGDILKLVDD